MSDEHRVLRLWVRRRKQGPMVERVALDLIAGDGDREGGVRDDHTCGVKKRHVTLVFEEDWREAEEELGRRVDPAGRRANVLLTGGGGGDLVGRTIDLGTARLRVVDITRPCPVMEQAALGLEAALRPGARGGVWARVESAGTVCAGDVLTTVVASIARDTKTTGRAS